MSNNRSQSKIELHQAYQWDCDNCGRENFARAVVVELNPDDPDDAEMIAIAKEENEGLRGEWTPFWVTTPDEVACAHCGAEYETVDSRGPVDDE